MSLRGKREDRQANGRPAVGTHYRMRQRLVSVGEVYWVTNDAGEHVFRVDGKAMRLRDTLELEDAHGTQVCRIRAQELHVRDAMAIEDADGDQLALVHKVVIPPHADRWTVDLPGAREWQMRGRLADHEYEIADDGHRVAEVSKRWFRVRDTYGVEIASGQNQALVLAVAVAVDAMSHPAR